MSTQVAEKRTFKSHEKLLVDVIMRQAGSLSKAIDEGVTNTKDAGGTECEIILTPHTLKIIDNGRGFRSKTEIKRWFEVFGQPHDESENKEYGEFRMGRGQLFSFGRNVWRSNRYEMTVDIRRNGLEYELRNNLEKRDGCSIHVDLYDELPGYHINNTVSVLAAELKYMDLALTINGTRVTNRPQDMPEGYWDMEDDDAFYRFTDAYEMRLFNKGMFCMPLYSSQCGSGGEIVSKKKLKVNFARNQVQDDCPVYKRILEKLKSSERLALSQLTTFNAKQRKRILNALGNKEWEHDEFLDAPVVELATGRNCSLREIAGAHKIASVAKSNAQSDLVMRTGRAMVIKEETIQSAKCKDLGRFKKWLESLPVLCGQLTLTTVAAELSTMDNRHVVLDEKQWTKTEVAWVKVIQRMWSTVWYTARQLNVKVPNPKREICIGESDSVAWTDGLSYIAFSRSYLKRKSLTSNDIFLVANTLLHELCHDDDSSDLNHHDQRFYERFHDLSDVLGEAAMQGMHMAPYALEAAGLKKKAGTNRWKKYEGGFRDRVAALLSDIDLAQREFLEQDQVLQHEAEKAANVS